MPRGDRTGPMGMGSKTGRGAGYCNGFAAPGCTNPIRFAGGFGGGFGRGFRRRFYADGLSGRARCGDVAGTETGPAAFNEGALLKDQAELLESRLQQIKKRLSSISGEAE